VNRRRRKMYVGHERLCLSLSLCLSVHSITPTLLRRPESMTMSISKIACSLLIVAEDIHIINFLSKGFYMISVNTVFQMTMSTCLEPDVECSWEPDI